MIFYFSGTGNSEWLAQEIADRCKDKLTCMANAEDCYEYTLKDNERVGFVFPVYGWSMPGVVRQFIENLQLNNYKSNYVYFAVTYGDDMGKTHEETCKLLASKQWLINSAFAVQMPNTYVAFTGFDIDKEALQQQKWTHAKSVANQISDWVLDRRSGKHIDHPGAFPWLKTHVLGAYFRKYMMKPERFWVTNDCVGCGMCSKGCPMRNIEMQDGKPVWQSNCAMCMHCYHQCPKHAVQYAKYTANKGQYLLKTLKKTMHCMLILLMLMYGVQLHAANDKKKKIPVPVGEQMAVPDKMVPQTKSHTNLPSVKEPTLQVDPVFALREGIDVSHYQGTINWQEVASEGTIGYAYMKATEGASLVDETYLYNITEARRYGLKVGSYHFFRSNAPLEEQLNNFLSVVKRNQQDLLPIVDVEKINGVSNETFVNMLHQFMQAVTKHYGKKPVLYTFVNFYNRYLKGQGFDDYPLMIAFYREDMPLLSDERPYVIWQYTASGTVPGIRGRVDRSKVMDGYSLRDVAF